MTFATLRTKKEKGLGLGNDRRRRASLNEYVYHVGTSDSIRLSGTPTPTPLSSTRGGRRLTMCVHARVRVHTFVHDKTDTQ